MSSFQVLSFNVEDASPGPWFELEIVRFLGLGKAWKLLQK